MYTPTVSSLTFRSGIISLFKSPHTTLSHFKIYSLAVLMMVSTMVRAQSAPDTAFERVLTERAAKIVATLSIEDTTVINKVTSQIAQQYYQLNLIHDRTKAEVTSIKEQNGSKEDIDLQVKTVGDKKTAELKQLHNHFLALLGKRLTADQIEKVKDGMTYRVLPVTWAAYMDMLQNLTQQQKDQMYAWLLEARELAMDEGSSDAKHAVFGKYKGRINNYLSAQGYDMKKEGEEWQKRIAAAKKAKQTN